MANGNGNGGPAGVGSAPSRSNGGAGRFNKGSLGSPWSREVYGPSGADPGTTDVEDGPRVGPGQHFGKRVSATWDKNYLNGGSRGNGNGR